MDHNLGKNIAELRKSKGWTQAMLAEKLNISDKAVSKWESGFGYPEITLLTKLAEIFELSIDYLMTGKSTAMNRYATNITTSIPVPLIANINHGIDTALQRIYDEGCKTYSWDKSKRNKFGNMQVLFANDATPDGYSVWGLTNCIIDNGRKTIDIDTAIAQSKKSWLDLIHYDGNTITEYWINTGAEPDDFFDDATTRLAFAKLKSSGPYVFLGIFKPTQWMRDPQLIGGKNVKSKTYTLISSKYDRSI